MRVCTPTELHAQAEQRLKLGKQAGMGWNHLQVRLARLSTRGRTAHRARQQSWDSAGSAHAVAAAIRDVCGEVRNDAVQTRLRSTAWCTARRLVRCVVPRRTSFTSRISSTL